MPRCRVSMIIGIIIILLLTMEKLDILSPSCLNLSGDRGHSYILHVSTFYPPLDGLDSKT